jgi:hypothetical protein
MKKLVLAVTLVVLIAAAAFGGQAIASSKATDISVSEETSEILFDWGGSYWGSPLRMQSFEGCFQATDYPDGYSGFILEESYPEIRHVSVTIIASSFDQADAAEVTMMDCINSFYVIDLDINWTFPSYNMETFEFNTDNWYIHLITTKDSKAKYSYTVTVTYPR